MAGEDDEAVMLLLRINEVFVYKLPPLKGHTGRRAEDWDLGNPALTGLLHVVTKGEKLYIQLFKDANTLFASAPIHVDKDKPLEFFLEPCRDTSRYFALRVEDERSKRHTYIGIGFRDRQNAFDLRAALDDQLRRITRQHEAEEIAESENAEGADGESLKPLQKLVDLSLKEGQKIAVKINLPPKEKKKKKKKGGISLSKPPVVSPTPSSEALPSDSKPTETTKEAQDVNDDADDDWGDFQS